MRRESRPAWAEADPAAIDRALMRALSRPAGGWYVLGATRSVRPGGPPVAARIAGRELVAWRPARPGRRASRDRPGGADVLVGPGACPHMGADLSRGGTVRADGSLVCPWHGLALGPPGHGGWQVLPAHDDGVLVWVRLDEHCDDSDPPLPLPVIPARPERFVDAVFRAEARCEPRDIVANRLDPWHGTHLHPHSFSSLEVTGADEDELCLDVTYRVAGNVGVPVRVTFASPERRTIVMTVVDGEFEGSVVETHATPLEEGRTAVIEATLATSRRPGFRHFVRWPGPLRSALRWAAARLWVDDVAYAERLFELRRAAGG
ncbi:MAG: DUF5914 domain-containing protein [Acidimicrobiales bacterium]